MASPQSLRLPPLVLREQTSIGELFHVLTSGALRTVVATKEVQISPRRTAPLLTLDDGEHVIVSSKRLENPPPEADGVLREGGDGLLGWAWHKNLQSLEAVFARDGWQGLKADIDATWKDAFRFRAESNGPGERISGLRPPQIGALHAIGAHWSLQKLPATIVMPTGTGKTETMIAALVGYGPSPVLVVVPSRVLRAQTANKFATLGLLKQLGVLPPEARNPIVGVITGRPETAADLEFLRNCHVAVGTMSALGQGSGAELAGAVAQSVDALFVDEAHHVPAHSWSAYREQFKDRRILQFTATPFRRDGKLVDGKVIYNYPLHMAQTDGYFKRISFEPVFEIDQNDGDRAIAQAAVAKLRKDLAENKDHLIMARCDNIPRATDIHRMYQELGAEFHPILVHSDAQGVSNLIDRLRAGQSRIVVCVDMLGEGFDLPQLKIAAIHDSHKSLAVLLQFTGRMTRTAGANIGEATVIANIANQEVSSALERLYSEDADWNHLLSEFSSEAVRQHLELIDFLRNSKQLIEEDETKNSQEISHHLLHPKFSTVVYSADRFEPRRFHEGVPKQSAVHRVWLNSGSNTLYFVTRTDPRLQWTRSQDLTDRQWDLFVLNYDPTRKLLYLQSSDKSSIHEQLAKAVTAGDARLIYGDTIFRALGRINRLQFQNIGVKKHGRRNLRYAMYTGADVAMALGLAETAGSEKSNLFGNGWENGEPVTIGCSYKGRIWSREQGTIPEFARWAATLGAKLQDQTIDTRAILQNVLIPEEVDHLPNSPALSIDWPIEMLQQSEDRVVLTADDQELPVSMFSISADQIQGDQTKLRFTVSAEGIQESLSLELGGDRGFAVTHAAGPSLSLRIGTLAMPLASYLSEYPPLVKFVDMSELDGNLMIKAREGQVPVFPLERFEVWDWAGVDIARESTWKGEEERPDSIQTRAALRYQQGGFEIIFDDDSAGEAADLVCLKEEGDHIRLALVHCKFTSGTDAGKRIKDVVEVCSQAVRSAKWKWRFRELCRHLVGRERRLAKPYRQTRFLTGSVRELNKMLATSRFKPIRAEIVVVQPGLSREQCTPDQLAVLASAHSFLRETVDINLDVVCSD